ncbi:phosphoadenosine phosphosulfate reductase family protein [Kitasatospora purpeofusca]|uniref:phosphoadenosine phosphosulfate reductase domain-containing protein n=1 Tax=Kitasatospora purpeofusca TaxID=67352 RepID=UPI0035D9A549
MVDVEMVPFPRTSQAVYGLKRTPEEVASLRKSEREQRVRELLGLSHWIVDRAVERYFAKHRLAGMAIMYSGGNDSTTLAHIFRHRADLAVHANTGIGVEQTRQFVRSTCVSWGLPLMEKSPKEKDSFRAFVLAQGFPGPAQHYRMFQRLKERCLEQARGEIVKNPYRERVLFLGGRRRSESARRAAITTWDRKRSMCYASPLTLWTKPDMNTYRLLAGDVPVNEVSDLIHMSGECLCGAFAEKNELDMIGMFFPDVVAEIEELEALIADRADIPEMRRTWGWGAYRRDLHAMKQQGRFKSGAMCSSCDARATGGHVLAVEPEGQAA